MDLISKLQPYAHLVPDEYKKHLSEGSFFLTDTSDRPIVQISMEGVDRYVYSLDGLRLLRDHPSVADDLQVDLLDAVSSLEYADIPNDKNKKNKKKKNK